MNENEKDIQENEVMKKGMKTCKTCGSPIAKNAKVCPKCGARFDGQTEDDNAFIEEMVIFEEDD